MPAPNRRRTGRCCCLDRAAENRQRTAVVDSAAGDGRVCCRRPSSPAASARRPTSTQIPPPTPSGTPRSCAAWMETPPIAAVPDEMSNTREPGEAVDDPSSARPRRRSPCRLRPRARRRARTSRREPRIVSELPDLTRRARRPRSCSYSPPGPPHCSEQLPVLDGRNDGGPGAGTPGLAGNASTASAPRSAPGPEVPASRSSLGSPGLPARADACPPPFRRRPAPPGPGWSMRPFTFLVNGGTIELVGVPQDETRAGAGGAAVVPYLPRITLDWLRDGAGRAPSCAERDDGLRRRLRFHRDVGAARAQGPARRRGGHRRDERDVRPPPRGRLRARRRARQARRRRAPPLLRRRRPRRLGPAPPPGGCATRSPRWGRSRPRSVPSS